MVVKSKHFRKLDEGKGDSLRSLGSRLLNQTDISRALNLKATRPIERQPISQRPRRGSVVVVADETDADDVIDLGAPFVLHQQRNFAGSIVNRPRPSTSPIPRVGRTYIPNPRLYPGPQQQKPKKQKNIECRLVRRRKNVLRRPVPNSRLYRPAPPRQQPPPLNPRTNWPPPAPPRALDTASRAAFRLGEHRRGARHCSPPRPTPPRSPALSTAEPFSRRIVVTLPQATTEGAEFPAPRRYRPLSEHYKARERPTTPGSITLSTATARVRRRNNMDAASRHSTSPEDRSDGNETLSAPSEFLAEFLSAIMRRQYAEALKYCRLILQYEPQNATARGFYPLLQHKVQVQKQEGAEGSPLHESSSEAGSSKPFQVVMPSDLQRSSSEASSPLQVAMEQEADSGDSGPEDAEEGSAGSVASQSSLELDSSDALHSSASLSLSRHTDSASGGMWESMTGSASRSDDADDNGNAPSAPTSNGQTTTNAIHPGDVENDNAAGDPGHNTKSESLASLKRLRAQFACSIK